MIELVEEQENIRKNEHSDSLAQNSAGQTRLLFKPNTRPLFRLHIMRYFFSSKISILKVQIVRTVDAGEE